MLSLIVFSQGWNQYSLPVNISGNAASEHLQHAKTPLTKVPVFLSSGSMNSEGPPKSLQIGVFPKPTASSDGID